MHPDTVRRAIHSGALDVAGYIGKRPRLRRSDIDDWVATGKPAAPAATSHAVRPRRPRREDSQRVLGNAMHALSPAVREAGGRS